MRVLNGEGKMVAKRKAWPSDESLGEIEAAALAGCPEGTTLEVVMEPTGPAWLPIAVFFAARGHEVFRVSSQKAADLRRFLSRHAKTNGIDAGPWPGSRSSTPPVCGRSSCPVPTCCAGPPGAGH